MTPWLLVPLVLFAAWAWATTRSIRRLRGQLDEAEARLARRFYKLQGRLTELDVSVRELDFERRWKHGEIRFGPETRFGEAIAVHPKVGEIFAAFGLAGSGCAGGGGPDEDATIRDLCRDARLDVGAVVGALARFVEDPAAPVQVRAATARLHQIQSLDRG